MKLSVLGGKKEKVVDLYLEQVGERVHLCYDDADGEQWVVLVVRPGGISRWSGFTKDQGFELDENGRVADISDLMND